MDHNLQKKKNVRKNEKLTPKLPIQLRQAINFTLEWRVK